MIHEHAISYKENITLEQINYIIKKAHRIGLNKRELVGVFEKKDEEGKHLYFIVESLKKEELKDDI